MEVQHVNKEEHVEEKNSSPDHPHVNTMTLERTPLTDADREFSPSQAVLNSWIAMEVLSPMTFRKPENLCDGNSKMLSSLTAGSYPGNMKITISERATGFIIKLFSAPSPWREP